MKRQELEKLNTFDLVRAIGLEAKKLEKQAYKQFGVRLLRPFPNRDLFPPIKRPGRNCRFCRGRNCRHCTHQITVGAEEESWGDWLWREAGSAAEGFSQAVDSAVLTPVEAYDYAEQYFKRTVGIWQYAIEEGATGVSTGMEIMVDRMAESLVTLGQGVGGGVGGFWENAGGGAGKALEQFLGMKGGSFALIVGLMGLTAMGGFLFFSTTPGGSLLVQTVAREAGRGGLKLASRGML